MCRPQIIRYWQELVNSVNRLCIRKEEKRTQNNLPFLEHHDGHLERTKKTVPIRGDIGGLFGLYCSNMIHVLHCLSFHGIPAYSERYCGLVGKTPYSNQ